MRYQQQTTLPSEFNELVCDEVVLELTKLGDEYKYYCFTKEFYEPDSCTVALIKVRPTKVPLAARLHRFNKAAA